MSIIPTIIDHDASPAWLPDVEPLPLVEPLACVCECGAAFSAEADCPRCAPLPFFRRAADDIGEL